MLATDVFEATGWVFSHNLAHKCYKQAGICSKARKYIYKSPGEEHIEFPHKVNENWNTTLQLKSAYPRCRYAKTTAEAGNRHFFWISSIMRSLFTRRHRSKAEQSHITIVWSNWSRLQARKTRSRHPPTDQGSFLLLTSLLTGSRTL